MAQDVTTSSTIHAGTVQLRTNEQYVSVFPTASQEERTEIIQTGLRELRRMNNMPSVAERRERFQGSFVPGENDVHIYHSEPWRRDRKYDYHWYTQGTREHYSLFNQQLRRFKKHLIDCGSLPHDDKLDWDNDNHPATKLSKKLAWLLRHDEWEVPEHLKSEDGSVPVEFIREKLISKRFKGALLWAHVIFRNNKGRFYFSDNGVTKEGEWIDLKIGAAQGESNDSRRRALWSDSGYEDEGRRPLLNPKYVPVNLLNAHCFLRSQVLETPEFAFHATTWWSLQCIMQGAISPMDRDQVNWAPYLPEFGNTDLQA